MTLDRSHRQRRPRGQTTEHRGQIGPHARSRSQDRRRNSFLFWSDTEQPTTQGRTSRPSSSRPSSVTRQKDQFASNISEAAAVTPRPPVHISWRRPRPREARSSGHQASARNPSERSDTFPLHDVKQQARLASQPACASQEPAWRAQTPGIGQSQPRANSYVMRTALKAI